MTTSAQNKIERLIAAGQSLLVDGGLASELEAQGHNLDTPLWSAKLIEEEPQAIVAAHRAYLDAGADVLITASYQLSALGVGERLEEQLLQSVALAERARAEFQDTASTERFSPLIAASVGPYGAALADGSEYRGDYAVSNSVLHSFHADRLAILDASAADILACETIPSLQEAEVLCELLSAVTTPAWISFSCKDGHHICDGTPIVECAALFASHPRVFAVGVNCTAPQFLPSLIADLRSAAPTKVTLVYPNSGEEFELPTRTWKGTADPLDCGLAAENWRKLGATWIGGCCRVSPAHIRAIRATLDRIATSS